MKIDNALTDDAVLAELGARLTRQRLERELTQAQLATRAGVAKRTLERIEAGASAQSTSLVRLLRALDLLSALETALPASGPTPMELLRESGKTRQRAPGKRQPDEPDAGPWHWQE